MPDFATQLLDRAKSVTGSDYQTAKALGVTVQRVSDWRTGRNPMPQAYAVLCADLAGMDASEWNDRALIERYQGTPTGDRLVRVLGKASAATIAATGSGSALAALAGGDLVPHLMRCIKSQIARTHQAEILAPI